MRFSVFKTDVMELGCHKTAFTGLGPPPTYTRTRTRTNTIPNGTKANAAGLSGMRAIAQKGENGRRGVVGGGVGHHVDNRQR